MKEPSTAKTAATPESLQRWQGELPAAVRQELLRQVQVIIPILPTKTKRTRKWLSFL
ncbi:MAG: hypothetical protein GX062_01235 [Firmicutes bacterium]|jgi:hypothetical protein|nr:hypothetical protein [Bacillota bacterium]